MPFGDNYRETRLKQATQLTSARLQKLSKFLSRVLRHEPELIGITLDPQGWANVDDLLFKSEKAGIKLNRAELLAVIETSEKKRFTLSADGKLLRAAQGHSVPIDLGLPPLEPPSILFHGTATRYLDQILADGLRPGKRQKVHLSIDEKAARAVGQRHGTPIILRVAAGQMFAEGFKLWRAENDVWLTDYVPPHFLSVQR